MQLSSQRLITAAILWPVWWNRTSFNARRRATPDLHSIASLTGVTLQQRTNLKSVASAYRRICIWLPVRASNPMHRLITSLHIPSARELIIRVYIRDATLGRLPSADLRTFVQFIPVLSTGKSRLTVITAVSTANIWQQLMPIYRQPKSSTRRLAHLYRLGPGSRLDGSP
jgi:hypothetical protein